jgi:ribose transport system permease protein
MAEMDGPHGRRRGRDHPGTAVMDALGAGRWGRSAGIWVATGLLFAVSAIFQPTSLGASALAALWPFAAILILAAVGQTLVVQQRGIDLSVPGFISLTVILVTHIPNGNSGKLGPAILLAYAISLAAGLVNGLLVTRVGITPIVQTLGMNAVLYGIDLGISQGTPTQTTSALQSFASASVAGIPLPLLIALVIVVIIEFVIKRTNFGRRFEACGANAAAGRAAGLRGSRYQISAYLGAPVLYCTAGVLLAGIVSQPDPFQGNNYLLPSVAAVALGGTSLLGGVGSVVASAVGALFLSQLQQFVLATGASAAVQNLVEAGALALAVTVYGLRVRSRRSRLRAGPPAGNRPRDGTADPRPGPYNDHRAPVT